MFRLEMVLSNVIVYVTIPRQRNGAIQDYVHPDDQTQPTLVDYIRYKYFTFLKWCHAL